MGTRGTKLAFGDEVGPEGGVQAAGRMTSWGCPLPPPPGDPGTSVPPPRPASWPGSAGPDHLIHSSAERGHRGVQPCPSTLSPAPPAPPLPLELCQCPAQKLWSPALTIGTLWTPRHRTHSHVHGHTHTHTPPSRAHIQTCPQTHTSIYVHKSSSWFG